MKQLHSKQVILEIRKSSCRRRACRRGSVQAAGPGWALQAGEPAEDTGRGSGVDSRVDTGLGNVGEKEDTGEVVLQTEEEVEEMEDKMEDGNTGD